MTIYNAMLRFGSEKIKHGSGFRSEFEPNRTEPVKVCKLLRKMVLIASFKAKLGSGSDSAKSWIRII